MSILRALKYQLLRDLKASWKKSAILGILMLVGLACWIPQIVKAIGPRVATAPASPIPVASTSIVAAAPVVPAPPTTAPKSRPGDFDWRDAAALLDSHPAVRTADVTEISGDPFKVDFDQFAPPVLFDDDKQTGMTMATAVVSGKDDDATATGIKPPAGLVLKSTVVGTKRRAAIINASLYYEGADVRVDGETYRITAIASRKVTLSKGDQKFELRIPTPHDETGLLPPSSPERIPR